MERKYVDLQEQLNQDMRLGHKASLRLHGLIRKLNSLKALVLMQKECIKKQLEDYVNKLSESLLEFRAEMLVELDTIQKDKFQEIAELKDCYETDIDTFNKLFEEAEKYVQFDRRLGTENDRKNVEKLLQALRQLLADQPDDKEMTEILHLEFTPTISVKNMGQFYFGKIEKAFNKPDNAMDKDVTSEVQDDKPDVENKQSSSERKSQDMQTQTDIPYPELFSKPIFQFQGNTNPDVNFQQQYPVYGQTQSVFYPFIAPLYPPPPGFAGAPLVYGNKPHLSPQQSQPCFQTVCSTNTDSVEETRKKVKAKRIALSRKEEDLGKSYSARTLEMSVPEDKQNIFIKDKPSSSNVDVIAETKNADKDCFIVESKDDFGDKNKEAIGEKGKVDPDCFIIENIDEVIDLTESQKNDSLEISRESSASFDSGIMSPPGFEKDLKEKLADRQHILLPLKPLRKPLRLPKIVSEKLDCQKMCMSETDHDKQSVGELDNKRNVIEGVGEVWQASDDSRKRPVQVESQNVAGTKISHAPDTDKVKDGHSFRISAQKKMSGRENKEESSVVERIKSTVANIKRTASESNENVDTGKEQLGGVAQSAVERQVSHDIAKTAVTVNVKTESNSAEDENNNSPSHCTDKELFEKCWREHHQSQTCIEKEREVQVKLEAEVKIELESTPEKCSAEEEKRKTDVGRKADEKVPQTDEATDASKTHKNVPQTKESSDTESKTDKKALQTTETTKTSKTNKNVPHIKEATEASRPVKQAPQIRKAMAAGDSASAISTPEKKAKLQKQTRQLAQCVRDILGEENKQPQQASYSSRLGAVQAHWLTSPGKDLQATFLFQLGEDLNFPIGVTTDREGNIIVMDTGNNLVKKYDSKGKLVKVIGEDVVPPLKRPSAVVIGQSNEMFVKDDACIYKFDREGRFFTSIGKRVLSRPFGLAMTPTGNLITLMTNPRQPTVVHLSPDGDSVWSYVYTPLLNAHYSSKCRFLAVSDNSLIVSDLGLSKIYLTTLEGIHLGEFGTYGSGPDDFLEPSGISVDSYSNAMIGDSKNNRIKMYRQNGTFIGLVQLDCPIVRPSGIQLTKDNKLIVVNYLQHHVKVYKLGCA